MELQFSLDTIREAASQFWKEAANTTVFAFHGEMGAGKTTFIHALCNIKGVTSTVGSPTYSLINEYTYHQDGIEHRLLHMDLYRLKSAEEAIQAGVEDALYSGDICLAEWPERAPGIFPEETVHVYIEITDSGKRRLRIARN
jgi:tRNA threonylcarbamoyladenosine biosynthesis protein TsaE